LLLWLCCREPSHHASLVGTWPLLSIQHSMAAIHLTLDVFDKMSEHPVQPIGEHSQPFLLSCMSAFVPRSCVVMSPSLAACPTFMSCTSPCRILAKAESHCLAVAVHIKLSFLGIYSSHNSLPSFSFFSYILVLGMLVTEPRHGTESSFSLKIIDILALNLQ
jgi:hypothetical protein